MTTFHLADDSRPQSVTVSEDLDKSPIYSTASIRKSVSLVSDEKSVVDDLFRWIDWLRRRKGQDLDAVATKRSVFDDPILCKHYWPKPEYENIHRLDIKARWTYREEQALVRKIDWRVMLWAAISFSALNLDRSNINQANSDNFLPDLGLTTNDFNLGNSVFRLSFLCAELPSQLISKRLGPDRWIPMQMTLWSVVTMCQFWLTGRTSFLVTRALLGVLQGGFIPDLILYMSYFYTKTELPIRLALFWMSSNACAIISSFIAFGVLHMRGILGKAGWRWLFLIEGLITLIIGVLTFFMMPPSPTQTKTWYRPNGWFNEREETICVTRVLRDDPTKGDMHNREGLTLKRLWKAACDYDLWPLYILGVMFGIPIGPPGTYLTLSLRHIGFNTFTTNLLTIPSQVLGIITMFAITLASEIVNDRSIVAMMEDVWALPCLVALYCLPDNPNPWVYFAIATVLLSYPYTHPIQVAWCSRNAGAVASRTVNASLYNMCVQASAVIYSYIYQADDAPQYRRGNRTLIIISAINLGLLYPGTKLYYLWRNRSRDRIWNKMTSEEKAHYLATTTDVGNRRLDFRFAH
ncbi:MFS general substrate transporter [Gloeophyllum trabeum ATCC 11539]|uniref:MFS general substrate transporter n=1 Tax=Gloeophyllum trabeum (strain ATCC 11539 / FP-39264 / Madison 617) TaxID=670483 RepID=S7RH65_GLOTA|nr:MFS general substrate transporter [Gloeophyllum trabeum ATCC 11539]EPQ53585.1 MFS general substrate transporter [Gloeophyllum trabeum ATCC 11539]